MARKCHIQRPHTKVRHHEEETHNTNSHRSEANSSRFLCEMIAILESTLSTALQDKDQTQNPHKHQEQHTVNSYFALRLFSILIRATEYAHRGYERKIQMCKNSFPGIFIARKHYMYLTSWLGGA